VAVTLQLSDALTLRCFNFIYGSGSQSFKFYDTQRHSALLPSQMGKGIPRRLPWKNMSYIYPFKPFILYSDACRKGIAGSLYQVADDWKEHPILFISRGLTDAETRYSATELECLAVVWCLHKMEHFVDGSQLTLYTDHSALKWIWDIKSTINSRLFRWSLIQRSDVDRTY
jgi:hypothetical protein